MVSLTTEDILLFVLGPFVVPLLMILTGHLIDRYHKKDKNGDD